MTLKGLENAVAGLSSDELTEFRAWFADYDAESRHEQIEADARAGRLDALADASLQAHREGNTREL